MNTHSKIKNIVTQLNDDLSLFKKTYLKIHKHIEGFIDRKSKEDNINYDHGYGINYYIWAIYSQRKTEELILDLETDYSIGKEMAGKEKTHFPGYPTINQGIYNKILPNRFQHSEESRSFVDRANYFLKYLDENFELRIPDQFRVGYDRNVISIYGADNPTDLIYILEAYLLRAKNLLDAIDSVSNYSENSDEIYSIWMTLLSKNKIKELSAEMLEYYSQLKMMDKVKKVILMSQRFNKNEEELRSNIKDQEKYDLELNRISKGIIDIIYEEYV